MIVTNILGGLGNQMFQYAVGRAVSLRLGVPLRLDISGFGNYGLHHGFELENVFKCRAEVATKKDIQRLIGWQNNPYLKRLLSRSFMRGVRKKKFLIEPHFHYWDGIKKAPDEVYLSGYWQSDKYFRDVASQIREDFSFRSELDGANLDLAINIGEVNAVSVHVRRGDYVSDPKTASTLELCSLDYYQAAIETVSEKILNPVFFMFSDDPQWVKENLKVEFPCIYVSHNQGVNSYNDMRLMSLCQHHIIANSSFSWWGAWLNPNQDKTVVAPKKWFLNNTDIHDIFPVGWLTV